MYWLFTDDCICFLTLLKQGESFLFMIQNFQKKFTLQQDKGKIHCPRLLSYQILASFSKLLNNPSQGMYSIHSNYASTQNDISTSQLPTFLLNSGKMTPCSIQKLSFCHQYLVRERKNAQYHTLFSSTYQLPIKIAYTSVKREYSLGITCASASVSINQATLLTRSDFRGTLLA